MNNSDKNTKDKYNANLTKDDLKALGDQQGNLKTELSDDTLLQNREKDVDFTGKDLDVPGRTLPKNRTHLKNKDEENQLYSQGSDTKDNLEETTEHIK